MGIRATTRLSDYGELGEQNLRGLAHYGCEFSQGKDCNQGERLLERPIRCGGCRGMIAIVPCRVCALKRSVES